MGDPAIPSLAEAALIGYERGVADERARLRAEVEKLHDRHPKAPDWYAALDDVLALLADPEEPDA